MISTDTLANRNQVLSQRILRNFNGMTPIVSGELLEEQILKGEIEVFTQDNLDKYGTDLKKALGESDNPLELLEKAKIEMSDLVKMDSVDVDGKATTVYVKHIEKGHKYIKRTGAKGNYKYWYKDASGKLVSGSKPSKLALHSSREGMKKLLSGWKDSELKTSEKDLKKRIADYRPSEGEKVPQHFKDKLETIQEELKERKEKKEVVKDALKLVGDIDANNVRSKVLRQEAITKVFDNLQSKTPNLEEANKLILDYEANDKGRTIKMEAISSVSDKITSLKKASETLGVDYFEKGGEGSRGGKIIGHTKSGKPIYGTSASKKEKKVRQSTESHATSISSNPKARAHEIEGAVKKIDARIKAIDAQPGHRKIADEKDRLVEHKKKLKKQFMTLATSKLNKAYETLGVDYFEKAKKAGWKEKDAEAYVKSMTAVYGKPTSLLEGEIAIWEKKIGIFKKTFVKDEKVPHSFPAKHFDFLYSVFDLKVTEEQVKTLVDVSESIMVDRLKNEVTVRCQKMGANAITAQLVKDVVGGTVKARDAKTEYAKRIKGMMLPSGYKDEMKEGKKEEEIKKASETNLTKAYETLGVIL